MKPSDRQEGGEHYDMPIQPVEFCVKNKIPYIEGNVIKYVCRHRKKNGVMDILKAIHYLELILQYEYNESNILQDRLRQAEPTPCEHDGYPKQN
tara:strand:+ start:4661 stop:4942 length:282 start_codon:yes stop_codon:yes gene_type:complete